MKLGEQLKLFIGEAQGLGLTEKEIMRQVRREYIELTLQQNNFNICAAARALKKHRNSVTRDIIALGIDVAALRESAKKPAGRVAAEEGKRGVKVS